MFNYIMKICIVIDSIIPVLKYGGTQRVMWSLGKSLVEYGHEVTFLCKAGSGPCSFAKIAHINPNEPIERQIPESIDIVHFNEKSPSSALQVPHIVTYHGNRINLPISRNAVFVSNNHAQRFGAESYVYNGLNWDDYPAPTLNLPRSGYHFLGKGAWKVKNLRGCISLVKKMPGAHLDALGASRFNFKMGIRLTFTPKVRFHNMVDNVQKAEIISRSRGLLFPVLWDEPFGLAIIESLYYGAPVFGTPHGSLPELVTDEVGILANDRMEMLEQLSTLREFSPEICNKYASTKFNSNVMAENYLNKYKKVIDGLWLNTEEPKPIHPFDKYTF